MSTQNQTIQSLPIIDNQSNLLQSQIVNNLPSNETQPNSFDDVPIGGGGSKFNFSQFPQQGQIKPPPKKTAPRKPLKASKKQEKISKQNVQVSNIKGKQQQSLSKTSVPLDQIPIGGTNKNVMQSQFDQKPIGKSNFNMSQFPQGEEPQAAEQTQYPMIQKLKSKAVKLRLSGMEDLIKMLQQDPNNADINQVDIKPLLKQTTPANLQKGLLAFKLWVEKQKKYTDQQIKNAIQNGLAKVNTKKITIEICDIIYENDPVTMQTAIILGLKGKLAKSITSYLTVIIELLNIYGVKKMKYMKPYMADVVKLLNDKKQIFIKTEGTTIIKQAYKWLGKDVVSPMLGDLKELIKKQVDTFWQTYDQTIVMKAPKDDSQAQGQGQGKAKKKKVDAYDISQAVDIFKKFNQKWAQTVMSAPKWNQKTKMMEEFIKAATTPKIANTQYRHITQMIKRLINDSNFNVVLYDLRILGVLSKGLRRNFYPVVKNVFSNVLSKFRDKKTQMVDETFNTLNDFTYSISLQDVIDDVKEGLGDKAPNMKVNLINWISKYTEMKVQQKGQLSDKSSDAIKSLFPIFQKLLNDGTADVRQCMVRNIGKMKILIGEQFFSALESKMNKNLASKLKDTKQKSVEKDLSKSTVSIKPQKAEKQPQKNMAKTMTGGIKKEQPQLKSQNKSDLTQEVLRLLPKMNDSTNWQNRKDSVENLITLISDYPGKVKIDCIGDLMNTLKTRINDPNKQLIKLFMQLTGLLFPILHERDLKVYSKHFVSGLVQGLSDKMESNKKEAAITLNKIGQVIGNQQLVSMLAPFLQEGKDSRAEVINIILSHQECLNKTDLRDFPKGIVNGLCDKNKEIRSLSQKLFEKVFEKLGLQVFRNLAKNQRPAFTKDLNNFFDKYQKSGSTSFISNRQSPAKDNVKTNQSKRNPPPPATVSAKKRSLSKSNTQQSFIEIQQEQTIQKKQEFKQATLVQGDQYFAPMKYLTNYRVERQDQEHWRLDQIKDQYEDYLREQITLLFRNDIAKKMLSFNQKRVLDSVLQLIKLCKDISYQNHFRELYDILIKWTLLRLWGGSPGLLSIVQVFPPIMSILQKKRLALNDSQIDLIIAVIREYFISSFMNEYKVSQSLHTILKSVITLSSGQKVLRKILRQFCIQLTSIHRYLKKDVNIFYRDGLSKLTKTHLMDFIGSQDMLQEASKIKQLKNDPEFIQLLFKKFHQSVLNNFGFKKNNVQMNPVPPIQSPISYQSTQMSNTIPNIPQRKRSLSNDSRKKSNQKKGPQSRVQVPENPSNIKPKGTSTPGFSQQSSSCLVKEDQSVIQSRYNEIPQKKQQIQMQSHYQQATNTFTSEDIELTIYPAPHPISPLGKHLSKLLPPNEQTIRFFTQLFNEHGQKIANQLITHAKVIFASILKSVMEMLQHRQQYLPQKIVNQINLLQQCIKCKFVIKNIQQLLYYGTNFALKQLVYEDQNKVLIHEDLRNRNIDYKIQNFIKVINGVMLRILQNGNPQQVINILLQILIQFLKSPNKSVKTIYLIIKCITRVAPNYTTQMKPEGVIQFFIVTNEYLTIETPETCLADFQVPTKEKPKPEENLLGAIKSIIFELGKIWQSDIWGYYDQAMQQSKYQDNHIGQYLNSLGIKSFEKPSRGKSGQRQNEQMKKISQLLSKNKTYDTGILHLKKYLQQNQSFSPIQYFTALGYDQKFISMVMNTLEGKQRKTPRKDDKSQNQKDKSPNAVGRGVSGNNQRASTTNGNQNIQDKIRKLKQKFQDLQPSKNQQVVPAVEVKKPQGQQQRAAQIRRRIQQMKNRMNPAR